MTKKDKVLNLFGFLMELLDENDKVDSSIKIDEDTMKEINPVFDYIKKNKAPLRDPDSLFSRLDNISKRNSVELGKTRAVNQAVKPLREELETLKNNGINNALDSKESEEIEFFKDEISEKMGVTIENGKVTVVQTPSELRDNIPLDEGNSTIGVSNIKETTIDGKPMEMKGVDDLPPHIKEKLSNLPPRIKEALNNIPTDNDNKKEE